MNTNTWDRGRYATAFVDLCDTVLSMKERGARAERIVAEIVGKLASPDMEAMLDFASELRDRIVSIEDIRGRHILDLPLDDTRRGMAETLVSRAINLCLEARGMLKL
jgi:hypothetical protein